MPNWAARSQCRSSAERCLQDYAVRLRVCTCKSVSVPGMRDCGATSVTQAGGVAAAGEGERGRRPCFSCCPSGALVLLLAPPPRSRSPRSSGRSRGSPVPEGPFTGSDMAKGAVNMSRSAPVAAPPFRCGTCPPARRLSLSPPGKSKGRSSRVSLKPSSRTKVTYGEGLEWPEGWTPERLPNGPAPRNGCR